MRKELRKEDLLASARKEFQEKGYINASLRLIVKNSGVTTGAFYRHFKNKESIFSKLVSNSYYHFLKIYDEAVEEVENLTISQQAQSMDDVTNKCIDLLVEQIYEDENAVDLLIHHSSGTKYEDLIEQLVEREVASTMRFMSAQNESQNSDMVIQEDICRMIAKGMFTAIFGIVDLHMEKEDAKTYIEQLQRFYYAGWNELLNMTNK